ncbi:MAG TPA: hypothetical protein VFG03_15300 [Telluria sp.]|nr:hypothetical protein [Telluria sp.]
MNAAQSSTAPIVPRSGVRGYQWKCLFLPDGTELRMRFGGEVFYARVLEDAIVYQGQRLSPRQLTIAIAGDGHNAWRELWLLLPGESTWKLACLRRRELERQAVPAPASPADTIAAAAAAMSDLLKAALALAGHAQAPPARKIERRVNRARRADDYLADSCQLD